MGKRTLILNFLHGCSQQEHAASKGQPSGEGQNFRATLQTLAGEDVRGNDMSGPVHPRIFFASAPLAADIRALKKFLMHAAVQPHLFRFVVLLDLDRSSFAAQTMLLKLLEEPPQRVLFLTTALSLGSVLATLRSRMRTFSLQPLSFSVFQESMAHIWEQEENRNAEMSDRALKNSDVQKNFQEKLAELRLDLGHLFQESLGCAGRALVILKERSEGKALLAARSHETSKIVKAGRENPGEADEVITLSQVFLQGLLPPDHPNFRSPFVAYRKNAWKNQDLMTLWEAYSVWLQELLGRFVLGQVSDLEELVVRRKPMAEWGAFIQKGHDFFRERAIYHVSIWCAANFLFLPFQESKR